MIARWSAQVWGPASTPGHSPFGFLSFFERFGMMGPGVRSWIAAQGPRGFDSGIWGLVGGAVVMAFVGLGLVQS
jgi:hypothetical protein